MLSARWKAIAIKDFSDKYFVSFDGDTLKMQGVSTLGSSEVVAGSQLLLAGF